MNGFIKARFGHYQLAMQMQIKFFRIQCYCRNFAIFTGNSVLSNAVKGHIRT